MASATRLYAFALLGLTAVYGFGHILWYSGSLLGLEPVLDGRENCLLAQQMAQGDLPDEPFYRAPVYPFVLSLFLRAGLNAELLPLAAQILNGLCHLLSTFLVFLAALRLWNKPLAAFLSGCLFGLNPVVLHFAGDPLDITLAITFMMLGLMQALSFWKKPKTGSALAVASWLTLASLTRPHLLTLALTWPLFALFKSRTAAAASTSAVLLGLLGLGTFNYMHSGSFAILPTQGGYNLWSANKPGANGLYFSQTLDLSQHEVTLNTAVTESKLLYMEETGASETSDPKAASAYWRNKTIASIIEEPGSWLSLMLSKAYYLFGNEEIYNNKTYAFHKDRAPLLRWNPLCWAILLSTAFFASAIHWRQPWVRWILLWALIYGVGTLIYYVSARFRLPLVPILAVLAGGCLFDRKSIDFVGKTRILTTGLIAVLVLAVSFFRTGDSIADKTVAEDMRLLAQAAEQLGRDKEALHWAMASLERRKNSEAAIELAVLSRYNLWLAGALPPPTAAEIEKELQMIDRYGKPTDRLKWLQGVYWHKLGKNDAANQRWMKLMQSDNAVASDALAMLILNGGTLSETDNLTTTPLLELVTTCMQSPSAIAPAGRAAIEFLSNQATGDG